MYAQRQPPAQPPCHKCRVDLLEENEDAARVYMMTRSQVLMSGMGDIIDINILAVCKVMDLYGIRNQKQCLEKVLKMFHIWQKNRKKNEN